MNDTALEITINAINLIENEDMKDFIRLVAIYRKFEEMGVSDAESVGTIIDMIIENVNGILLERKIKAEIEDGNAE